MWCDHPIVGVKAERLAHRRAEAARRAEVKARVNQFREQAEAAEEAIDLRIIALRGQGLTWREIAPLVGLAPRTALGRYRRYERRLLA